MRSSRAPISAFLMFSLCVPAVALAKDKQKAPEWEFVSDEENVRVFRKEVPGSDVVAFKGVTTTNVSIGKLLAVFKDPNQRQHWVDRYKEHKTFERGTDNELYWIHFKLPWPI